VAPSPTPHTPDYGLGERSPQYPQAAEDEEGRAFLLYPRIVDNDLAGPIRHDSAAEDSESDQGEGSEEGESEEEQSSSPS
jgi:hypothetical protein